MPAPSGTVSIRKGRAWVKVINHEAFGTGWVVRSHYVWWRWRRQRVPKGYVLHHKDENKLRDVMSNLQLMTLAEHRLHHNLYAASAPEVRRKITEGMRRYYATDEGKTHLKEMTRRAFSDPKSVAAMNAAISKESKSVEGRQRRSALCKQMWKDGRMKASSEEMRRRYLCSARAKRLNQR